MCNTESIFLCVSTSEAEPPPATHYHFNHCRIVSGKRRKTVECSSVRLSHQSTTAEVADGIAAEVGRGQQNDIDRLAAGAARHTGRVNFGQTVIKEVQPTYLFQDCTSVSIGLLVL